MIIKWLLDVVTGFLGWVVGLLPSVSIPVWMSTTVPNAITTIGGYISSIDVWLPFSDAGIAVAFVVVALAAAVAIKIVRIVASFVTAGGGSAG